MFRKFATLQVLEAFEVPQRASRRALRKAAHRVSFEYEPRPGYLYVRSRAISSRCNDNYDEFPAEEIKKAYQSFIGKPVFVNHHNEDHRRARGVIIDAALHEDRNQDGTPDTWAEVLMEVDAVKFPKLAKAILAGEVDRTSMGCDVQLSVCSACGNKATNPAEYCHHIPAMKGQRIFRVNASTGRREGHLVREICSGLSFFENSLLVEEPADPTAFFTGVDDRGLKAAASRRQAAPMVRERQRSEELSHGGDEPPRAMEEWGGGGGGKNHFIVTRHRPDYFSLTNEVPHDHNDRHVSYHYSFTDALHKLAHLQNRHEYSPSTVVFAPKMEARRLQNIEPEYRIHYSQWFDKNAPNHNPHPQVKSAVQDMSDEEFKQHYKDWHSPTPLKGDINKWRGYHDAMHGVQNFPGTTHRAPEINLCPDAQRGEKTCNYQSPGGHEHAPAGLGDIFSDSPGLRSLFEEGEGPSKHSMRKRAISDEEIQRGLNLPKAEDTHDEVTKMKGKDLAESWLKPLYEPYGGEENYRLHQHNQNMMDLKRRYENDTGRPTPRTGFGFDDEDDGGEAYYEIRHPSGWSIRHYADGPHAEIRHRATPGEAHEMLDIGGDYGEGANPFSHQHPPENFGHKELKGLLDHWVEQDPSGMREYMEGPYGHPKIRRWKRTMGSKTAAHKVFVDEVDSGRRLVTFSNAPEARMTREDGKWWGEDEDGMQILQHSNHKRVLRGLADHYGLHDDLDVEYHNENTDRRSSYTIPAARRKQAGINDVVAPPDVDTLRDEECPVCGETEVYDGERCPICGFVAPPAMFRDPDLEMAQKVDLRQEQQGDNTIAPGQMNPDEPGGGLIDPSQLGEQQGGSFQDAQEQLQHPDQLVPDGVPTEPGTPADGVPDLFCPACGYSMDAGAPMTTTTDNPEAPAAQGPEEGMVCPNCGQATMLSISDAEQGGLLSPDQLPAGEGQEGDQSGQLMDPNDLPPDQQGQEGVPGEEGTEETTPDEEDADGTQVDPNGDQDDSIPDQGDVDDEAGDDEDAVDDDDPAKKKRESNSKGASRMSKAVEAAVRAQAGVIDSLTRKIAALEAQNAFLAKMAGVEKEFAAIQRHADINNPASPIPDPPEEAAYESTEQALAPETMDDPQNPGTTPGSVNRVPAEQTATPMDPGMTMPTSPANQLVDVTAPVAGTNTGEVPLEQRRIETDVRIGEDPLRETGPGLGGVGNNGTAFPWTMSSAGASNRTMASLRLAKLRITAGLAQGDEFTVASKIETDATLSDPVIAHEIRTLETMTKNARRVAPRNAGLVPKAARSAPSMASMASVAKTGSADDAADFEIFLDA